VPPGEKAEHQNLFLRGHLHRMHYGELLVYRLQGHFWGVGDVEARTLGFVLIRSYRKRSVITMATNFNHLTPNGHFSGRTAPLTYRYSFFFIYSTAIRSEYFKHAAYSPFFPL
jgi:hypothetical protein